MSTLKRVRLCRVDSEGEITTFHVETSSDIVLRPDGTSVEQALTRLANTGGTGTGTGTGGGSGDAASSEEFKELKDQVTKLAVAVTGAVSSEAFKAFQSEVQAALEKKANKKNPIAFSIPANAWVSDGTEGYPFYYNIAAAGVTAVNVASIELAPACIDIASAAQMCATIETISGAIRIRCKLQPTGIISGEYSIE